MPYLLSERGREKYEIKALLNSSAESARKAVEFYKLPPDTKAYGSPGDLAADKDIDLVVCATRVDLHYDTIKPSLEAGKAAFVEWPLAENEHRAKELAEIARQKSLPTFVGLQGRVAPCLVRLKELLKSGDFGKVLSSSIQAASPNKGRDSISDGLAYFLKKEIGGNSVTIAFGHSMSEQEGE